jgi:hypothetical protein
LESISQQKLTPENALFFNDLDFNDGVAYVDVHDYRVTLKPDFNASPANAGVGASSSTSSVSSALNPSSLAATLSSSQLDAKTDATTNDAKTLPSVTSFPVYPDNRVLLDDIYRIAAASNVELNDDMMADIEAKILVRSSTPQHNRKTVLVNYCFTLLPFLQEATETDLCLDPSPSVLVHNNTIAYNQTKYRNKRKRPRESFEKEEEAAEKKTAMKMMMLSDEVCLRFCGFEIDIHLTIVLAHPETRIPTYVRIMKCGSIGYVILSLFRI